MTCWEILNLPPTTSKRMIKKAYVDLLKHCNPEDNPQAFQTLRKAYEQAVEESRFLTDTALPAQPESATENASQTTAPAAPQPAAPVHSQHGAIETLPALQEAVVQLYQHVEKRGQLQEWQRLLQQPVCWNLDGNHQVCEFFIRFLAVDHYLPKPVLYHLNDFLKFGEEYARWRQQEDIAGDAEQLIIYLNTLHLRLDYTAVNQLSLPFEQLYAHLQLREQIENAFVFEAAGLDQLQPLYRQVDAVFAGDWDLHAFMARLCIHQGDFQRAAELYEKVVEHQPLPEYLLDLAELYYQTGKVAQARALFQSVLSHQADNVRGLKGIALCYVKQNQLEIATHLLEEVARILPADFQVKTALTSAKREYLAQLGGVRPAPPENVRKQAQLLYELDRFDECLASIEPAGALFSESVLKALCYKGLGKTQTALTEFCRVIRNVRARNENLLEPLKEMIVNCYYLLPEDILEELVIPFIDGLQKPSITDPDYFFAAAVAHNRIETTLRLAPDVIRHHKERAVVCINRAVAMQPLNDNYHFYRGFIMLSAKRYEDALESHYYAQNSYRYLAHIPRCMGDCYVGLNAFDEAVEAYERALSLSDDVSLQKIILERIYKTCERKGDFAKAIATIREYLPYCQSGMLFLETHYKLVSLLMQRDAQENGTPEWTGETLAAHLQFVEHCMDGPSNDATEAMLRSVYKRLILHFRGREPARVSLYEQQLECLH